MSSKFLLKYGVNNTHYDIDKLVDDPDWSIRYSIARNPNLNQHHIDKLVNDPNKDVRKSIAKHPKFKE